LNYNAASAKERFFCCKKKAAPEMDAALGTAKNNLNKFLRATAWLLRSYYAWSLRGSWYCWLLHGCLIYRQNRYVPFVQFISNLFLNYIKDPPKEFIF